MKQATDVTVLRKSRTGVGLFKSSGRCPSRKITSLRRNCVIRPGFKLLPDRVDGLLVLRGGGTIWTSEVLRSQKRAARSLAIPAFSWEFVPSSLLEEFVMRTGLTALKF